MQGAYEQWTEKSLLDCHVLGVLLARFLQERAWTAESVTHSMSLVLEQFQFLISQAMDGRVTVTSLPWKRAEIFRPAANVLASGNKGKPAYQLEFIVFFFYNKITSVDLSADFNTSRTAQHASCLLGL